MYYSAFISVNTIIILIPNIKNIFCQTYKNGKPHTVRPKANLRKKRHQKLQKYVQRKIIKNSFESERNFKDLWQNGLERIAKTQNLSQNELEQITKMMNLSQKELEQIVKMRRTKNYKNLSKEELLIALLKSERSQAEHYKSKSYNAEIEDTNISTY